MADEYEDVKPKINLVIVHEGQSLSLGSSISTITIDLHTFPIVC